MEGNTISKKVQDWLFSSGLDRPLYLSIQTNSNLCFKQHVKKTTSLAQIVDWSDRKNNNSNPSVDPQIVIQHSVTKKD